MNGTIDQKCVFKIVNDIYPNQIDDVRSIGRLNQPLPAKPIASKGNFIISHPPVAEEIPNTLDVLGDAKREWTSRHLLGGATILGKSCQATLILAEHNKALQTAGYMFGCNLALAFQANLDHSIILHEGKAPFELICAPLMFHIQENSDFYDTLMENVENNTVDYRAIVKEVRSGSGLAKTVELKDEFALNASSILKSFPESRAKLVLSKFIKSLM